MMSSEEIILYIVNLFESYLDELSALPCTDFIHGEMTAYVETLEILQMFHKSTCDKLDFDIEDKYKI